MGAIASGGVEVLNREVVRQLGISASAIDWVAEQEQRELKRREHLYRGERQPPELRGRTVILVDDGLATGSTMQAAVIAIRSHHPGKIVVAAPVAARDAVDTLRTIADDVVTVWQPEPFFGVGMWYRDFTQTTDEQVADLLAEREVA